MVGTTTAALGLFAPAALAAPGDIFVVNFGTPSVSEPDPLSGILKVDPVTGERSPVSQNNGPTAGPTFEGPGDIAREADGSLIVADRHSIIRVNPTTGARSVVSSNSQPASGPSIRLIIAVDVAPNGDIYVLDNGGDPNSIDKDVMRIDPVTGARTVVSSNSGIGGGPKFAVLQDLAIAPDGDVFVADSHFPPGVFGGAIIRVDPATGQRTVVSSNQTTPGFPFSRPKAVAVAPNGDLLVGQTDNPDDDESPLAGGSIVRVDPVTGERTLVSSNTHPIPTFQFGRIDDLAFDAAGDLVVVSDDSLPDSGKLIEVDAVTGASYGLSSNFAPLATPFRNATGLVIAPDSRNRPGFTATASGATTLGGLLTHRVIVSNRVSPGPASVTFRLHGPATDTCGPTVFTSTVPYPTAGGPVTSAPFTPTVPGTYRWTAVYSGDESNRFVKGRCDDPGASTEVSRAKPELTTTASADITLDTGTLKDSAVVTGRFQPAASKVTFRLYGPADPSCTASPVFVSQVPYPVLGGTVSSDAFTPTTAGTYRWVANYSGDDNNEAVAGACNDPAENAVVLPKVKVSVSDVTVTEGSAATTPATFRVTLDRPSDKAVRVDFATQNATATAPADYAATSRTVTVASGATGQDVVVPVVGDTTDEPDETFAVKLSNPNSGAEIADGDGVGTIIDDERDGAFTCRASAARLLGLLEPVVANGPGAPCRDASAKTLTTVLSVLGLGATVSLPNASTDQTPDVLAAAAPAVGDRAVAHADLQSAVIGGGVSLTSLVSDAEARCTGSKSPVLSTSGKVVGLKVNGRSYEALSGPLTISLLGATLRINQTIAEPGRVTRRAVWLDNALLPDVILGEASAGFSGNPCDA